MAGVFRLQMPALWRVASYSTECRSRLTAAASCWPLRLLQRRFFSQKREAGATEDGYSLAGAKTGGQQQTQYTIFFVSPDEKMQLPCSYRPGQTLLDIAFENGVDVEGACGGRCACSTCHVILNPEDFKKFPDAEDEEAHLLEDAPGWEETSRLGCQLRLTEAHHCLRAKLPEATVNQMYS